MPSSSSKIRTPKDSKHVDADLEDGSSSSLDVLRFQAKMRLKATWESILEKYGRDFGDETDEIDLSNGSEVVVVDKGFIKKTPVKPIGGSCSDPVLEPVPFGSASVSATAKNVTPRPFHQRQEGVKGDESEDEEDHVGDGDEGESQDPRVDKSNRTPSNALRRAQHHTLKGFPLANAVSSSSVGFYITPPQRQHSQKTLHNLHQYRRVELTRCSSSAPQAHRAQNRIPNETSCSSVARSNQQQPPASSSKKRKRLGDHDICKIDGVDLEVEEEQQEQQWPSPPRKHKKVESEITLNDDDDDDDAFEQILSTKTFNRPTMYWKQVLSSQQLATTSPRPVLSSRRDGDHTANMNGGGEPGGEQLVAGTARVGEEVEVQVEVEVEHEEAIEDEDEDKGEDENGDGDGDEDAENNAETTTFASLQSTEIFRKLIDSRRKPTATTKARSGNGTGGENDMDSISCRRESAGRSRSTLSSFNLNVQYPR
ncbi:hypothetical protein HK102_009695 [Quaeritorhiza haematococci]|nr:hypothetical protein HK102_009695 [Quaeritorhiza haematococci]